MMDEKNVRMVNGKEPAEKNLMMNKKSARRNDDLVQGKRRNQQNMFDVCYS